MHKWPTRLPTGQRYSGGLRAPDRTEDPHGAEGMQLLGLHARSSGWAERAGVGRNAGFILCTLAYRERCTGWCAGIGPGLGSANRYQSENLTEGP